jgi:hypothetical protein
VALRDAGEPGILSVVKKMMGGLKRFERLFNAVKEALATDIG